MSIAVVLAGVAMQRIVGVAVVVFALLGEPSPAPAQVVSWFGFVQGISPIILPLIFPYLGDFVANLLKQRHFPVLVNDLIAWAVLISAAVGEALVTGKLLGAPTVVIPVLSGFATALVAGPLTSLKPWLAAMTVVQRYLLLAPASGTPKSAPPGQSLFSGGAPVAQEPGAAPLPRLIGTVEEYQARKQQKANELDQQTTTPMPVPPKTTLPPASPGDARRTPRQPGTSRSSDEDHSG